VPSAGEKQAEGTQEGTNEGTKEDEAEEVRAQRDQVELAAFIAQASAPITRQDQFYVATVDQHVSGQANPLWLTFRVGRCTGSGVGGIYGVNRYCSRRKQLQEMIRPTFLGNCMTQYGNKHEDEAQACFATWQSARLLDEEEDAEGFVLENVDIENFGLCICRAFPAFAMSPDGFLVETWVRRVAGDDGDKNSSSDSSSGGSSDSSSDGSSDSNRDSNDGNSETMLPVPHAVPVEAPGVRVEVPGVRVEAPGVPVEAPGVPVEAPGVPVEAPGVPVEAPGVPVEAPGVPVEAQVEARVEAQAAGPRKNGTVRERRADGAWYEVKTKRVLIEYKCPWGKRAKTWYDDIDVYPLESIAKVDGLVLPMPSYYFAQCAYGMHVLGVMDDMLSTPEYAYFVVWHPAKHSEAFPDFWVAENAAKTSLTVAGEHGTIQITRVPYLKAYCESLEASARTFWYDEFAPALWRNLKYGEECVSAGGGKAGGGKAGAAQEVEVLDFAKKSYTAPVQRTIEDCLASFGGVGKFAVAPPRTSSPAGTKNPGARSSGTSTSTGKSGTPLPQKRGRP
jgi:hypothetical protein